MLVMVLPFFGRFLLSLRSVQSCESIYFVSLVADSRLQDSEESCAKTAWGLGRDGVVEPVSIVFNTSLCSSRKCPNPFPPSHLTEGTFALHPHLSGTPWKEYFRQKCCCTIMRKISLLQHLRQSFGFASNKHIDH